MFEHTKEELQRQIDDLSDKLVTVIASCNEQHERLKRLSRHNSQLRRTNDRYERDHSKLRIALGEVRMNEILKKEEEC